MKHLLGIEGLPAAELERLLESAAQLKSQPPRLTPTGAIVVNLFFEASTRTRVSFEIAALRLGHQVVNWTAQGSSQEKGETLLDTAHNLAAMKPAAIVVRHAASGAPAYLAARVGVPIVNAGDGAHEHPSQALLDAFTLRQHWGPLTGRTIAIVGDIAHSRVARSALHCFTALGARVRVCGPSGLLPAGIETLAPAVTRHTDLDEALAGVDAVMALRLQRERLDGVGLPGLRDYHRRYGVTRARLDARAPRALVLHPGPLNRGVELTSEVADGPESVILEQVESGVAVRMAILKWVLA